MSRFFLICACAVSISFIASTALADAIPYTYAFPTTDGSGGMAFQPQTSGTAADATHNSDYTVYSNGELNDGDIYVGSYEGPTFQTASFWNTGRQVGTKNTSKPTVYTAPSILMKLDPSQTWALGSISVNYMVDFRVGIHAPDSANVYFSSDGINWSAPTVMGGWNDTNPSYPGPNGTDWAYTDLYMNVLDVSGIPAAAAVKYVRLDLRTDAEWGGLVEIGVSSVVPEPGTLALFAAGMVGLLCYAWRKRR
jgi:hypothetical protein